MITTSDDTIRTEPRHACIICGERGNPLFSDLPDRLFGSAGTWNLVRCVNAACGLVWLDPAPCRDDLWKAYARYYTHQDLVTPGTGIAKRAYRFVRDCYLSLRYGYVPGLVPFRYRWLGLLLYLFPGRRADVDFSVMYLPAKVQGRLLEVGCGSGSMLNYMGSLGWLAEGVDVDPSAIDNARSKGLKVALGSLEEQGFADNSFDAVIMSHVIEHVPDPQRLVNECFRVLKPGGVLSLVTPNMESFGCAFFRKSWLALDPPRHLMLHNISTILTLSRAAGFAESCCRTTIRDAHMLFWASYRIKVHGTYIMGSNPAGWQKLFVLMLRLLEWSLIKVFPRRGEEIALIGIK